MRSARAGALAALVWAAVEPLDKRVLAHDYSDVAVLGKAVTRSRAWPLAGLAVHAANGAVFGARLRRGAPSHRRRRRGGSHSGSHSPSTPRCSRSAPQSTASIPPRGSAGLAPLWSNRAFAQATFRHALFGAALGRRV